MSQLDQTIKTQEAWVFELETLEQEQDLKGSCLSWWQPKILKEEEEEYFEMMAEAYR